MRFVRPTAGLIAAAVLVGCAVGPDHVPPRPALDGGFVAAGSASANAAEPGADLAVFWRGFRDPSLDALVERAIDVNFDVRIAAARLQESAAVFAGARAARLPEVGVDGGVSRSIAPEYQFPNTSTSQRTTTLYDGSLVASWELDFFGRARRGAESAEASLGAASYGLEAARTSVVAEVARLYLELRGLQQRLEVAETSIANQRDALRIVSARLEAGRGTRLDTARAQSLVESTEAERPALQSAIETTSFRIATLTADTPRNVLARLAERRPLPSLPVTDLGTLPLGTPEGLLRRRPDIAAAERQLAAATADIGVATADLFPRISLTGLIGFATTRFASIGESGSQQASLGAGISWPLLDFGRVRARIAASEARSVQALARYEQTVATALEETEGALAGFTRSAQRAERLAAAAEQAGTASRLARLRFDAGVTDFLNVLDAERETLTARNLRVQAEVQQATSLVALYRALGGGWTGVADSMDRRSATRPRD